MTLTHSNEPDQQSSSTVSITVLSVTPARAEKLFAFASVEIDIDGVQIGVVNIGGSVDGFSFGLINIVPGGRYDLEAARASLTAAAEK